MAGSFVVHGALLAADYEALVTTGMFCGPQQAQPLFPLMLPSIVPTYLIYNGVQPMPAALGVRQIVYDGELTIVLGLLVARSLRQPARAA